MRLPSGRRPNPGTTSDQWYGEYFANPKSARIAQFRPFSTGKAGSTSTGMPPPLRRASRAKFLGALDTEYLLPWTALYLLPDGRRRRTAVHRYDADHRYLENAIRHNVQQVVDLTEGFHLVRLEILPGSLSGARQHDLGPPNSQNPPLLRVVIRRRRSGWHDRNRHQCQLPECPGRAGYQLCVLTVARRGRRFSLRHGTSMEAG